MNFANNSFLYKIGNEDSRVGLEYNQEDGTANYRGFSFYGEPEEEIQVKKQMVKYKKLRQKYRKHVLENSQSYKSQLCLSSPSSSLNSSVAGKTGGRASSPHEEVKQQPL